MSSDGWSSRNRTHFITTSGLFYFSKIPLFLNSTNVGTERETTEYLVEYIQSRIKEIGAERASGFITDNAANFKSAQTTLEEKFPAIFFGNCIPHSINLMVNS